MSQSEQIHMALDAFYALEAAVEAAGLEESVDFPLGSIEAALVACKSSTNAPDGGINVPNAATSAGGAANSETSTSAGAQSSVDSAFFASTVSSVGLRGSEASSEVEGRFVGYGFGESAQSLHSGSPTGVEGSENLKPTGAIMPNHIFAVRDDVAPDRIAEEISLLSGQALAVLQAAIDLAVDMPLHAPRDLSPVVGLLFALNALLQDQRVLCERVEMLDFQQAGGDA